MAPRQWIRKNNPKDLLLCECEMVSTDVIDSVAAELQKVNGTPDLIALGLRTRMGKGACQGSFCGLRVVAHLYNTGRLQSDQGTKELRRFFEERWKGLRPALWDGQLVQSELTEALHCGLLGLELAAEKG